MRGKEDHPVIEVPMEVLMEVWCCPVGRGCGPMYKSCNGSKGECMQCGAVQREGDLSRYMSSQCG
jgi:hypothetical protein